VINNKILTPLDQMVWRTEKIPGREGLNVPACYIISSFPALFDSNLTTQKLVNTTKSTYKQTTQFHCSITI
jgi:hypothetical protein